MACLKRKTKTERKKKKNPRPIVPSLNRDKKLNANSAMPRCVFEARVFRFCQDLQPFLNKMKSGVGGSGPIDRGGLWGSTHRGREAPGGSRPADPAPEPDAHPTSPAPHATCPVSSLKVFLLRTKKLVSVRVFPAPKPGGACSPDELVSPALARSWHLLSLCGV